MVLELQVFQQKKLLQQIKLQTSEGKLFEQFGCRTEIYYRQTKHGFVIYSTSSDEFIHEQELKQLWSSSEELVKKKPISKEIT